MNKRPVMWLIANSTRKTAIATGALLILATAAVLAADALASPLTGGGDLRPVTL